jgi:hypothetical protein|nr:MAG TPA: hypothetical protein [Caudoviricetes sp.]
MNEVILSNMLGCQRIKAQRRIVCYLTDGA